MILGGNTAMLCLFWVPPESQWLCWKTNVLKIRIKWQHHIFALDLLKVKNILVSKHIVPYLLWGRYQGFFNSVCFVPWSVTKIAKCLSLYIIQKSLNTCKLYMWRGLRAWDESSNAVNVILWLLRPHFAQIWCWCCHETGNQSSDTSRQSFCGGCMVNNNQFCRLQRHLKQCKLKRKLLKFVWQWANAEARSQEEGWLSHILQLMYQASVTS